jgi:hypothetical protein
LDFDILSQVLQCIGDLFQGAYDIMNWLTGSARIISKSVPGDRVLEAMEFDNKRSSKSKNRTTRLRKEQMTAVVWTTPLGLPIVQPYRKIKRKQIKASLQTVYISDPNAPAEGEQMPIIVLGVVLMRCQFILQSTHKSRPPLFRPISFTAWMQRICCSQLWNVEYDFPFCLQRG